MTFQGFAGRRAVITGGSQGIGFAVARLLHHQGASVVLVARHLPALKHAAAQLSADGREGTIDYFPCDLGADRELSREFIDFVQNRLGGLDYLVNAAGGARVTGALQATWEQWHADFSVKFWGYFAMIRALVPMLRANGRGAIVNIAGVSGIDPNSSLAVAGPVNAALRALAKVLADELAASQVRVVNIHPGATETALLASMAEAYAARQADAVDRVLDRMRTSTPLGRLPSADDVATLACFLLSDQAALITGTGIEIDGGVHRGLA